MTVQSPLPDFSSARAAMVEGQLRPQGVTDRGVLEAMGSVARETFVPGENGALAYADRPVALGGDRFLGPPVALGMLLTAMMPRPGERALVIGGGTGYSAAVLAAIGLEVIMVESDPALAASARDRGIAAIEGALGAGHRKAAPYQHILIDGAIEDIPDALITQLTDGGRLGAALVDGPVTRLIVGRKAGSAFGHLSIGDAGVPRLPGFARPPAFTF